MTSAATPSAATPSAAMPSAADAAATLAADPFFVRASGWFRELQLRICDAIEHADGQGTFAEDAWERPHGGEGAILGGHGWTRIMEDGAVFERAGIGFSLVFGRFSDTFAAGLPVGQGNLFAATGVSLVFHPRSPHIPTVHMNYRRLTRGDTGWFGGGADLTPYYLVDADARHFHAAHKAASDAHAGVVDHETLKTACDRYFRNHHRDETRGIGGTFFDYLTDDAGDREATFAFIRDAGQAFIDAYVPIVQRNKARPYTDAEREWQLIRRGRYVEFNLIHDRGTTFGLRTGGRTESILMSMPPLVSWRYRHEPAPDSPEARLVEVLKEPVAWHQAPPPAAPE